MTDPDIEDGNDDSERAGETHLDYRVITRGLGETCVIGGEIRVSVVSMNESVVELRIDAPAEMRIHTLKPGG